MHHPLQCRCGKLQGYVSPADVAARAVCYCKDCQAFAHFLERPEDLVLNELGGTEIVATLPKYVHFTQGVEALVCMSLSGRGLLRWYTSCCNTPIGNTPRDFKTSYVGVIHSCLNQRAPSIQESFGPVRMVLQTNSARGKVTSTPMSNVITLIKIMKSVIAARMSGSYKSNPFFIEDSGAPIKQPRVLSKAERTRVTSAI
jgi:Family of unknown function (DUF6151)